MDIGNNGLGETRTIVQNLNKKENENVDVFAWIGDTCTTIDTNGETNDCSWTGMGYTPGACDKQGNYRTSLTRGPSRGVIETAEVSKYRTFDSFHILNV